MSPQAGLEPITLLRWSPCGSYLLAGHPSGAFRIWETRSWWSVRWAAAGGGAKAGGRRGSGGGGGGPLVDAFWSPDGRTLLLAHANAAQLLSLHFTASPPSLQAQLLPVQLPELVGPANGGGVARGAGPLVAGAAWDARGQRLALALGDSHPAAGCVALYDTALDPILTARFIGFASVQPLHPEGTAGSGCTGSSGSGSGGVRAGAEIWPEGEGREGGPAARAATAAGTGGGMSLAFHPAFDQGALLAVRQGQRVAAIPMYFAS